ncbi:HAD-IC family P-type ATPase [Acidiferrimicrobium sp. IK]|uniref:HAD-IC family P-type ATPase n=1 Tax=Acidiferrimicrobium sp. IK TaxID=2871700 RepID=UPI0021CB3390|nr:HAD-IC family P-type ATPase [Acidiferrimicrobium sp. IK]MCU4183398.1 HAD-IC family P-type ATPase [Acidiferrimicrobium sp. IK]
MRDEYPPIRLVPETVIPSGPLTLPAPPGGLTTAEVEAREAAGEDNRSRPGAEQTGWGILARNTFTWLNLLFSILGAASLATGAGPDATFMAIAVINTAVGTVQELRARTALDALRVVSAPVVRVVRDGRVTEIPQERVVLGEVMELAAGDQVVADATVASGHGECDESLATGESDPVAKAPGDRLLSGTWVVSGALRVVVTGVGADSYAGRLALEARRFSLSGSELMDGITSILRWLSVVMLVIGPILVLRQLQVQPWRGAVRATVAALVGMLPEGLVLLTTLAFLTAALRLGRRRVLVQQLPAVETLARVDALCIDKTGTLTEGALEWGGLDAADPDPCHAAGGDRYGPDPAGGGGDLAGECRRALGALGALPGANATLTAIGAGVGPAPGWQPAGDVPFSSARKWSAAAFAGHGTWVLGAPEMVAAADPTGLGPSVAARAAAGDRVLVLARTDAPLAGDALPAGLVLVAAVWLRERIRPDAAATVGYFARQGVEVRVISGDAAATAGAVAAAVGVEGALPALDARSLPAEPAALAAAVAGHRVFGRVTPEQKREMVDALRSGGHVIAMTGDGVNDTLALKHADLGVAMGSGSAVARGVAKVVLLDDQFAMLPSVVSEGRRVLHNVERVATLFLVKNVYSIVVSLVVAVAGWPYPFLPRHLTLISGLAIGIPGFFLALAPSEERFEAGFVGRVVRFSAMAGALAAVAILVAYALARAESTAGAPARSAAVMAASVVSLWVLVLAARPLAAWKVAVIAAVSAALAASFVTPGVNTFFSVDQWPGGVVVLQSVALGAAAATLISVGAALLARRR